jgi:hypothetical protein
VLKADIHGQAKSDLPPLPPVLCDGSERQKTFRHTGAAGQPSPVDEDTKAAAMTEGE